MTGKDIVMFSLQSWDMDIGGNFKDNAKVIVLKNRVSYVNRPLDVITRIQDRKSVQTQARLRSIRGVENSVTEVEKNLWVLNIPELLYSINFLPKGFFYTWLNKKNNRMVAKGIRDAMKKLEFKNEVLLIDNDFFNGRYLKEYLNPEVFIYYLRDYLRFHKYFQKHGSRAEPEIISKADAVITDSVYLDNYARQYNRRCFYIPKGCSDEFRKLDHSEPDDLKEIPHPRVGYLGALTSKRIDVDLLEKIAKALPEYNFVFIGPEDEVFKKSVLHQMSNVFFPGFKEQSLAPAYIQHFDVCTNIQVINETTIGNHPRKILEYLSAGKPVVATKTDAMMEYENLVFLCDTESGYIDGIKCAVAESGDERKREARILRGNEYTWEATTEKFYKVIEGVYENKKS